jgi:hypothetical protein
MQTHRNLLVVSLIATLFVVSSCKSCKNKFAKKDTAQEATSTLDTSMYAGLADTSIHSNSTASTSSSVNTTTTSSSTNSTASVATTVSGNSSGDKKMASDVEKQSASQYGSHSRRGGVSYSIYDGINDQEERYVVRKAEGYNDAYYIDDYNGTNKFYEEHYKKASKLEKPMADYIDKSMNLPSNAYANGPTQKIVDQQLHQDATPEEPKTIPAATSGGTGTIGISKKSLEKKPKK